MNEVVKIELIKPNSNYNNYSSSLKQSKYFKVLLESKGYKKYVKLFDTYKITKVSASKLIDSLKSNKKVEFFFVDDKVGRIYIHPNNPNRRLKPISKIDSLQLKLNKLQLEIEKRHMEVEELKLNSIPKVNPIEEEYIQNYQIHDLNDNAY